MLRIHEVTTASDAKRYYAASDYYAQGQETVGRWGGKLAAGLGLAGTVDKARFDQLCDNIDPATGGPLTQRTNENRRVLYDFTFSGPKSFSVLEGLAEGEAKRELLAAFDAAVDETMVEAEADMQTRIRLGGQEADRTTGNMIWAGFDHSTSRPIAACVPDPHRHRHVCVFNATLDPVEGRIKAGQFAGIPQSAIDKFSKRTDEIEDEAARRGIIDERQKAELGAKTRGRKQKELTPDQLRDAWDAQLTEAERDALAAVYRREIPASPKVSVKEAVAFAIAHCTEKFSVLPERELKRVALLHGLGSGSVAGVAAELPSHGVITGEIDGRVMATTGVLQREEDFIASVAAKGRGQVAPVGVPEHLSRSLSGGRTLNDGQWQAVLGLLESSNRVNLVEGPAGAGKSSLLGKYDEAVRAAGGCVTYLATTAAAADVLQKDGFDAQTLARFLVDERMQQAARGGRVVIDESSMLGHKDAVRLMGLVESLDLKPVFVGDPMQHGAVPRGSFLHVLKEYGCVRPHRLTHILRQHSPDYRAAATLLSEGRTLEGFDALDAMGWVKELGDDERYQTVAADYLLALDEKKSVLVVSPTHSEAGKVTDAIRGELRAAGRIGAEDRPFVRLVAVDATEAERGLASTYRVGDVLQFHQNAVGFTKGDRLTVGDPAGLPLHHAGKFSLYRPQPIGLAEGDTLRFTATVKTMDGKHLLRNGASRTLVEITPGGNLRLDNGWLVAGTAGHFRHGVVETSFGAQGRTVDRAILAMSSASLPATNQEQAYVSASRARERMMLYTDDVAAVRQAVQRSSRKLAALDLKVPAPAKPGERLRQDMGRRRRLHYLDRLTAAWSAAIRKLPRPALVPKRPALHAERLRRREGSTAHER